MNLASDALMAYRARRVIDGTGAVLDDEPTVLVKGRRIEAVGPAGQIGVLGDTPIIDLGDFVLMPGLMDIHLHLTEYNVLTFGNSRVSRFETSPQLQMLYALLHAQMCLEMGFTTLRDLGGISYAGHMTAELVALRNAIDRGLFDAPRLRATGWVMSTGSHLDLVLPRNAIRQQGVTGDGPSELRKLTRAHLRLGCDWIKTSASGGGGTDNESEHVENLTLEELTAIVEEAHAAGKRCACHCFTPQAQKKAVRAGVDTIEHCVYTDDEALKMMKSEGKILVPTLAHRTDDAIDIRRRTGSAPNILEKMKRIQPATKETFQRVHAEGITIAMGTDTQIDPEMGANARELEIYVEYGMTSMEAIQTATRNTALALGLEKETGTLEVGKYADFIAIDGDPLSDIRVLQEKDKIKVVAKEGAILVDRRDGCGRGVVARQNRDWVLG